MKKILTLYFQRVFSKTKSNYTQESPVAKIKELVSSSCHNGEGTFKLRVQRNHVFNDFCEKMESPWYQRQIGQNIYAEFYGEAAVDQGGLKRTFFTGRYIIVEYFKLVRVFIEIPVFFHFWSIFPYYNHWKRQKTWFSGVFREYLKGALVKSRSSRNSPA